MPQIRSLDKQVVELEPAQRPDIEVLLKACRYTIEFRELYQESDFNKVDRLLARAVDSIAAEKTPAQETRLTVGDIAWTTEKLQVGSQSSDSASHLLLAIRPNPLSGDNKYLVFTSGLTFRQSHDRTNSLQNPHLPDWTVISLSTPHSAESHGAVAAAGFFDDAWKFDPELTW